MPHSYISAAQCACGGNGNPLWRTPAADCLRGQILARHQALNATIKGVSMGRDDDGEGDASVACRGMEGRESGHSTIPSTVAVLPWVLPALGAALLHNSIALILCVTRVRVY